MNANFIKKQINELIEAGSYDQIKGLILKYKSISEKDNDISTVFYLLPIYESEKAAGQKTLFEKVKNTEQLLSRYTKLKFYLRRIDFDVIGDGLPDFFGYLIESEVSPYELNVVMKYSVVHKEKVLGVIRGET